MICGYKLKRFSYYLKLFTTYIRIKLQIKICHKIEKYEIKYFQDKKITARIDSLIKF